MLTVWEVLLDDVFVSGISAFQGPVTMQVPVTMQGPV